MFEKTLQYLRMKSNNMESTRRSCSGVAKQIVDELDATISKHTDNHIPSYCKEALKVALEESLEAFFNALKPKDEITKPEDEITKPEDEITTEKMSNGERINPWEKYQNTSKDFRKNFRQAIVDKLANSVIDISDEYVKSVKRAYEEQKSDKGTNSYDLSGELDAVRQQTRDAYRDLLTQKKFDAPDNEMKMSVVELAHSIAAPEQAKEPDSRERISMKFATA